MRELYLRNHSFIHHLDARVKLLLTLVLIISISLLPVNAWAAYILNFSLILSIAILSRLGYGVVLKRSLLALPFILAALPLIFTGDLTHICFPSDGEVCMNISIAGSMHFASIAIKSWLSVQAAVLLAATTPFQELVTAMKQLRVPAILTAVIGLMWRYLFVIIEEARRLMRARSSRSAISSKTARSLKNLYWRVSTTGGMAGSLFLRSLERSDRVYVAMLSRGYTGGLTLTEKQPLSKLSWKVLGSGICTLVLILIIGLLVGG